MSNAGRKELLHLVAATWHLLNIPKQQQLAAFADGSS
jgi:hypothetical protein